MKSPFEPRQLSGGKRRKRVHFSCLVILWWFGQNCEWAKGEDIEPNPASPRIGAAADPRKSQVSLKPEAPSSPPIKPILNSWERDPSHGSVDAPKTSLEEAMQKKSEKDFATAANLLNSLIRGDVAPEIQRSALFELAALADETDDLTKALQIYGDYLKKYPNDPGASEVLLRQGLVCRRMGANALALSKFYAVLSTAVRLKPDRLEYYQRLVVRAQTEIAETYFLQGQFTEAVEFLGRLLKLDVIESQRAQIVYKLIQSLSALHRFPEVIAKAQTFIEKYPEATQLAEVRFLLADALKKLGRDREAVQQVMTLLEGEERVAHADPVLWNYWRQRAGNEIANQLYNGGDYINALAIYKSLATLDNALTWRLPTWYQVGLLYERLQQPQKAMENYARILAAEKELSSSNMAPSLVVVLDMARWRQGYLQWLMKAEKSTESLTASNPLESPELVHDSDSTNH